MHYECACRDCCERGEWIAANGAQGQMVTDQGPPHMMATANSFREVIGIENIKTYKARADSPTVILVADCCKSNMGISHPAQVPVLFSVLLDFCKLKCDEQEVTRDNQLARFFTASWDKANDPDAYDLPPFNGPQIRNPGKSANPVVFTYAKMRFFKKNPRMEGDIGVEDIIKQCGEPTVLGLDQSKHIKKPA